jgi:hypothetical protein
MNTGPIKFAMTQLAELEQVEAFRRNFSLGYWANKTDTHALDAEEQLECGFSGCFMGWAIHQQWFAPFGLVLGFGTVDPWKGLTNVPADAKLQVVPFVDTRSSSQFYGYALQPAVKQTEAAIEAMAELFGVQSETLGNIIYEEAYPTSEGVTMTMVRQRLAELLAHGEDRFNDIVCDVMEQWNAENAG